jgi:hypothetical protein
LGEARGTTTNIWTVLVYPDALTAPEISDLARLLTISDNL